MKAKLRKACVFCFRLTPGQRVTLERVAQEKGKLPSEFVRETVLRAIGVTEQEA